MSPSPRLVVVGHPLAAEENRLAFRGWTRFQVDLVAPVRWHSPGLGHAHAPAPEGETGLHLLPVVGSGYNSLFLWRGLDALLRRLRPDLLYCWEEPWCLSTLQARRRARRLDIPLVFYTAENRPKRLPWPFGACMRAAFRDATACVTPTTEIAATVRAAGYAGSLLPIPLWIRKRRAIKADPAARTLAYVGRLIPLKRVHLLIEALTLLPGYRLRIMGDGPERPRLKALAAERAVADRVDFAGHVDNAVLEERLEGVSLLVLPTGENPRQAEQFGKAVLEAVSCGLPVLASRCGNLAVLAEEFSTITARELDDPGRMARAVLAVMEAYPAPEALAEARGRVIGRYGPAAAGMAMETAFASLLATRSPGPVREKVFP